MKSNKFISTLLIILLIFVTVIGGTGCGGGSSSNQVDNEPDPTPQTTYIVTFNSNGGSEVPSQTVVEGEKAIAPIAPTKNGYTFGGWYSNADLTGRFSFNTPITANITLYARWNATSVTTYTVTFDSNGGSEVSSVIVPSGNTISAPENPTKTGYVFAGWYKDSGFTAMFVFGTDGDKVTQDITLYAQWLDADLLIAEYAASEIVIGYANGDNAKSVTKNLILPNKIDSADIIWVSNSNAVSLNGIVTRQYNDVDVTLTATAMYNGKSSEAKTFNVKVIRKRTRENSEIKALTIEEASSGDISIERNEAGDVTNIEGQYVSFDILNVDDALDAVTVLRNELGIRSPNKELETFLVTSDAYSSEYAFSQFHKGAKVWGRKLVVSVNSADKGDFLHSSFLSSDIVAKADGKSDIGQTAAEEAAKNHYSEEVEADTERTEKVIYSLENYENNPVYAYIVRACAYSTDNYTDESVFVNAATGKIIKIMPNTCNISLGEKVEAHGNNEFGDESFFDVVFEYGGIVKKRISYFMRDPDLHIRMNDSIPVSLVNAQMSPIDNIFNQWTDTHQVSVYSNMCEIMKWWKKRFNRDSLDGKGTDVDVVTHANGKKDYAEWNGFLHRMFTYDRASVSSYDHFQGAAVDVLTHETTHAVMQYITGEHLQENAAGAINEAYADVLACVKDENWKMGERLFNEDNAYHLNCIRDIANPSSPNAIEKPAEEGLYGPIYDIYRMYIDYTPDKSNDYNYVHRRSLKVSHAAYLMHESNDANGLTWKELGDVWYKSMHKGLDATSRFEDVQRCVLSAAKEVLEPSKREQKLAVIRSAFSQLGYGSKATLTGTVTDYNTEQFVLYADIETHVGATTSNTDTGETGHFSVTVPEGNCSIEIKHQYENNPFEFDYVVFKANMKLSASAPWGGNVLNVQLVRPGAGSINGKIVAYTIPAKPIKDVTLKIRRGWNNQESTPILTTTTDSNGQYKFNLGSNGAGYYTIEMSKGGKKGTFNVTVSGNTTWQDEYFEGVEPVPISPDVPAPDSPDIPPVPVASGDIPIDEEHFPDEDFRDYVSTFDLNGNNVLNASEIEKATNMNVSDTVKTLKGIEYFTYLDELHCNDAGLISLDLSNNTVIRYLSLNNNALIALNVSGCSSLETLRCNENKLKKLDLNGCTALKYLDCSSNELISLDLRGHTTLETVNCYDNLLGTLNLSGCTALKTVDCENNYLSDLDLSDCTSLESIKDGDAWNYRSDAQNKLNVSNCTALKRLVCDSVLSLNASGCTALEELYVNDELEILIISSCTALKTIKHGGNETLVYLDASNCISLESLNCHDENLAYLNVSGCTSLKELLCYANQLETLDLTSCMALQTLDCRWNKLTTLDLSNCTLLLSDNTRYDEGVTIIWPSNTTMSVSGVASEDTMNSNDDMVIVAILPTFIAEETCEYIFEEVSFDKIATEGSTLVLLDEADRLVDLQCVFLNDDDELITMPLAESLDHVKISAVFEAGKAYSTVIVAKNDKQNLSGGGCNIGAVFGSIILFAGSFIFKKMYN